MLKEMILINSANFVRAEFDLSKETFFVGSNAGGKTTSTRALHFLYNSNPKKLGIPTDKTSFKKHYYPYEDSYIIYTFKTFFIFTYKRGTEIHRYFSKQEFDKTRIFGANNSLNEHEDIIKYIKESSWYHPKTIEEYTDILYGKNKKYIDFSISKVKNYETFIEILNLVFNVDKAIVDSISIKRAIQKALNRDDEIVTLDFAKYIKKLRGFETDYYFFREFDRCRIKIDEAVALKDELLGIEDKQASLLKMIHYRRKIEKEKLGQLAEEVEAIVEEVSNVNTVKNKRKRIEEVKIPRVQERVNKLSSEITSLEELKEVYSKESFEENSEIANKAAGVKKEVNLKNYQLQSLTQEKMSAIQAYDTQIEQLEHKIKITIPQQTEMNIKSIIASEGMQYEEDKKEIENEYTQLIDQKGKMKSFTDGKIEDFKEDISKVKSKLREKKLQIQEDFDCQIDKYKNDIKQKVKKIDELHETINEIQKENNRLVDKKELLESKYSEERTEFAQMLISKKVELKQDITTLESQIKVDEGTFHEFLSNEVVNWEKELYPVMDESLLKMDVTKLSPVLKDKNELFGIEMDLSDLKSKPTPQEVQDLIEKAKKDFSQYRIIAHAKIKEKKVERTQQFYDIETAIQENKDRINNIIENEIEALNSSKLKIEQRIEEEKSNLKSTLNKAENDADKKIESIKSDIEQLSKESKTLKEELTRTNQDKIRALKKLFDDYEFNINAIKKVEKNKEKDEIKAVQEEIKNIDEQKKKHDEDEVISKLSIEVKRLDEEYKKCLLAIKFLEDFEKNQDKIEQLHSKKILCTRLKELITNLKVAVTVSFKKLDTKLEDLKHKKEAIELDGKSYKEGSTLFNDLGLELPEETIQTEQYLLSLLKTYKKYASAYKDKKVDLKDLISKMSDLEKYPLVEIDLSLRNFDESQSISELVHILDSLSELYDFKLNKYESQKTRSNREFKLFLKSTLPQKLTNFNNLENEFIEVVDKINKNLKKAKFGVVRDIRLEIKESATHKITIGKLFEKLGSRIKDTASLYAKGSLFYHDVPKSVENIENIILTLGEIKQRGTEGEINLFDAIDLSMAYVENGKEVKNKTHIKNDSSSGGNILLKVAIAISILNVYYKPDEKDTPFYLIIDEVSRLQHKNQTLLRDYINIHGFKTLFITPDALYPNLDKAIYYVFKNIEGDEESLRVTQMNRNKN